MRSILGLTGWRAGLVGLVIAGAGFSLLKGKDDPVAVVQRPRKVEMRDCTESPGTFLAVGQEFENGRLVSVMDEKCPGAVWVVRDNTFHATYRGEAFLIAASKVSENVSPSYCIDYVRGESSCAKSPLEIFRFDDRRMKEMLLDLAKSYCGAVQQQPDGGLEVSFDKKHYRVVVEEDRDDSRFVRVISIRGVDSSARFGS